MTEQEIRKLVEEVAAEKMFQNFATPRHVHNGRDAQRIDLNDVRSGFSATGTITMSTSQRYTLGMPFNPKLLIFSGIASNTASGIRTLVTGSATFGPSYYFQPESASSVTTGGTILNVVQSSSWLLTSGSGGGGAYGGRVASTGTAVTLPSGWSSSRLAAGVYQITHNLGTTNYGVAANMGANGDPAYNVSIQGVGANSFRVEVYQSGVGSDEDFSFVLSQTSAGGGGSFRARATEGHLVNVDTAADGVVARATIPNMATQASLAYGNNPAPVTGLYGDRSNKGYGNGFVYVDVVVASGWSISGSWMAL